MSLILDSASPIPAFAARSAGYVGVARYLSAYIPKAITKGELAGYRQVGLVVVLVYEDGAQDALGGANAGTAHGRIAAQQVAGLGLPASDVVVYVAVDFDVQPTEYAEVAAFLNGFQSSSGCVVAPYASAPFIAWWFEQHPAYGWVSAGWTHGVSVPHAQIVQEVRQVDVGGVTCDVNTITAADFGQWPRVDVSGADPVDTGTTNDGLVPGFNLAPAVAEVGVIGKMLNSSGLARTRNVSGGKTLYAGTGNPTQWHANFDPKTLPAGTPLAVAVADLDAVSHVIETEQL